MGNWYISSDGEAWQTLAAAGIDNASLTFRANGIDEFRFDLPGDFLAVERHAFGSSVALKYDDTVRYRGRINTIPRQGTGHRESVSYGAVAAWWWLEQIVYAQQWQMMRTSDNQLVSAPKPRIIIGQDDSGNRRTLTQEIEAVVDFAIGAGAPIAKGTIDAGPTTPYSEHTNMRCSDVIMQCMRFMPDRLCYFDHSTTPYPTFHCRCINNLTAASIDIVNTVAESVDLSPRYDLQIPGIRISYEQTHSYDGSDFQSQTLDSAGELADPRCIDLLFELAGSQISFMRQKIEVEDYPAAPYTDKAFWVSNFSWLEGIDDDDLSIDSVTRSGSRNYSKFLKKGSIQDWMSSLVHFEDEVWGVKVSYIRRDELGESLEKVESKELRMTLRSTNASTREYRKIASFDAAETIPDGVAAALYASWSRLQWEGSVTLAEQEASFVAGPGRKLNLANGMAAWATMDAAVQEVSIDVDKGVTRLLTGPSGLLEAEALVSLFRACHARRYSWRAPERNDALVSGAESEGAYQLPREKPSEADPGECRQLRVSAPSGERTHTIELDPSVVDHEDSSDSADRTLQPREMWIPEMRSGPPEDQLVMRRRQVMASAAYHDGVLAGSLIRLKELLDVTIGTPANWEIIRWDAVSGTWINSPLPAIATDLSAVRLGFSVLGGIVTLRAGKLKLHGTRHMSISQTSITLAGTQFFYVHHVRSSSTAAWAVAGAEPGVSSTDLDITFYKFVNGALTEPIRPGGDIDFDTPI